MKVIDFHTHLDCWFDKALVNETEFLKGLDRCDVRAACIFTMMGFYGNCPEHNDRLVAYAAKHPQRLIPFVTVDPKIGAGSVHELERCLSNSLFRGVKFHNWLQSFASSLVQDTMIEILKCAANFRVPVLFHDGTPPYATTFQIAALARRVPEATIVLGHGGLADYVYEAGQLAQELSNLYICTCGPKSGDLLYLIDSVGPDKIVFGSDFGFLDWRMLQEQLDTVEATGMEKIVLEKILWQNAERLLQL